MNRIFFLTIGLLTLFIANTQAQRYGHLNMGNLIESMPEVKLADQELASYQKQLVSVGEQMAKELSSDYQSFLKSYKAGELTEADAQAKNESLTARQQKILQYEQDVVQKLEQKRIDLLRPVITRAENAVEQVAKDLNLIMVFNTSVFNSVLFADDSRDIFDEVKSKLNN